MTTDNPFPLLTPDNHEVTSQPDVGYNCIAWAAQDTNHWWQPVVYWRLDVNRDECGIGELVTAFESLGYETCPNGDLEPDHIKVALYGAGFLYTHAARQLDDGKWTSKLGKAEDIMHDSPEAVSGGIYGEVVQFMKCRRD